MLPLSKSLNQVIPWLSEYDQPDIPEGALDPLGLYPISDALTVNKLCPGVRERQKHPGLLIPIAIGARISEQFASYASDNTDLAPMQVFEWNVVQALVHTYRGNNSARLIGLPGKDKVATAIDGPGNIAAGNYLKTPSVFGFYGVYKLLARNLEILNDENMGEQCERLISAWYTDQKSNIGNLRTYYDLASEAVEYGLKHGKTNQKWKHWELLAKPLNTNNPGEKSGALIWELLTDESVPLRSEYLKFLINDGAHLIQHPEAGLREKELHNELKQNASPEMKDIINTIQLYEQFARLLLDAFNHILYAASKTERAVNINELTKLSSVIDATNQIPVIKSLLEEGLQTQGLSNRIDIFKNILESTGNKEEWVNALLDHHQKNQQDKPPNGKMPFFDQLDNGSVITRAEYRRHSPPEQKGYYVHAYRAVSLWSFAHDLGKMPND